MHKVTQAILNASIPVLKRVLQGCKRNGCLVCGHAKMGGQG